jgi:hypothetical protein
MNGDLALNSSEIAFAIASPKIAPTQTETDGVDQADSAADF